MADSTQPVGSEQVLEEQVRFVADARLISVLGEQLIGSEKVGILELVKNAYDAGATNCTVTIEAVPGLKPETRSTPEYQSLPGPIIEIRDDGSGMTHEVLVGGWLRPATPSRAHLKERLRAEREAATKRGTVASFDALVDELKEAHGGRLPLGEKGIGRLATHRLGQFLWLRTKTAEDPLEWELKIPWSKFDSLGESPVNLDSVELTLRHQPPTTTYGARESGTVVCCYGGRPGYEWTQDQIIDIGLSVNALRSPRTAPASFEPQFCSPHVSPNALASPLERVPAPFELIATVDQEGKADVDFRFSPPAFLAEVLKPFKRDDESLDLRRTSRASWKSNDTGLRQPECGPFILHVRAWLRVREWLGPDFKQVTEYLDRFGGITVYRDGLATLPAQQSAKVDWLGLALDQIKKTSSISYYHLAGEVEIQQERTLALRDRSSREGMIETQAYKDLALLTRSAVDLLQFEIQAIRERWKKTRLSHTSPRTLRAHAKIASELSKALVERYDFRKDPLKLVKVIGGKNPLERVMGAAEALRELGEQLELQADEREGLLEAAGFGLAIGVGVHELAKLATGIVAEVRHLKDAVVGLTARDIVESIQHRAEALLSEVQRLAPLRVTRTEAARPFSIRTAIEAARNVFVNTLEDVQIVLHVDKEDFEVQGRFGAIAQVFANLFDNSIYWIGSEGGGGAIQVAISAKDRTVLVADSGPGISEKMKEHLFEPFYSEKSPPSGLGLYICRYYLSQSDATIRLARLAEGSKLRGAQFLLDFSKSQNGKHS